MGAFSLIVVINLFKDVMSTVNSDPVVDSDSRKSNIDNQENSIAIDNQAKEKERGVENNATSAATPKSKRASKRNTFPLSKAEEDKQDPEQNKLTPRASKTRKNKI